MFKRPVRLIQCAVGLPEIVVRIGILGHLPHSPKQKLPGCIRMSRLSFQNSKFKQRLRMNSVDLQDFSVEMPGLFDVSARAGVTGGIQD